MKPLLLDKIASVTLHARLGREVRITANLTSQPGDIVAVVVRSSRTSYDQLELCTGRFSRLKPGDVIAGALGHRKALRGFAGEVPESLAPGDEVHLLNLGGVLGLCTADHPDLGRPFRCEVLGQVLAFPYLGERVGVPANIGVGVDPPALGLDVGGVPVIAVAGTCMSAGKTQATTALIQECARRGLRVHAGKATGVSLRRDIWAMEDAGATRTGIFTDLGVVTTTAADAPAVARTLLTRLAAGAPDLIVLELGDGLMGAYGVDAILADEGLRGVFRGLILAANDPVGAFGGSHILRRVHGIEPTVVTGPATDNATGADAVERDVGVPAVNARTDPEELARLVLGAVAQGSPTGWTKKPGAVGHHEA